MRKKDILISISLQAKVFGLEHTEFHRLKKIVEDIPTGDDIPVEQGNIPVLIKKGRKLPKTDVLIEDFRQHNRKLTMYLDTSLVHNKTLVQEDGAYLLFDVEFLSASPLMRIETGLSDRRGLTFDECLEATLTTNCFSKYKFRGMHASMSYYHLGHDQSHLHVYTLGFGSKELIKVAKEDSPFIDRDWVYPMATVYK